MSDGLSAEVRDFLRQHINSVSLLEVLLLLKRNHEKHWNAQEVSNEMRTNPSYAQAQLEELVHAKLLHVRDDGSFRFAPASVNTDLLDEIETLYIHRRYAVMNCIYAQPIDSIRDFANAFKIKKD